MSSSVDIISSRRDSVLKVPIQCVVERGEEEEEKTGIFVVVDGKAHFREVKTGISSETKIEIKEGVEEEEMVVSGPYSVLSKLKDGDDVKTKKPPRKKGKGKKGGDEEEKRGKSSGRGRKRVRVGG